MKKSAVALKYYKIADTNTPLPFSGSNFLNFYSPTFDGKGVAFYGNNLNREGIYYAMVGQPTGLVGSPTIVRVSDSQTPIAALNGAPTSNDSLQPPRDAYVSYLPDSPLSPCNSDLDQPRPLILNEGIAFFAANWQTNTYGIFSFNTTSTSITPLVTNTGIGGNFSTFSQPTGALNMVCFSGINPSSTGVFTVPIVGGTGGDKQLLNIANAVTPDGQHIAEFGNSQIQPLLPESTVFVFGRQQPSGNEAIYSCRGNSLQYVIKPGQNIGGYTVPTGADTVWHEFSQAGNMVVLQTQLNDSDQNPWAAVVAATVQGGTVGTPQLICISTPQPAPGGGIFSGNAFATPPVTDGKRIAFSAQYEEGFRTDLVGLYVWGPSTAGKVIRVMDATSQVDGQMVTGIDITNSSFVDGMLAVMLQLGDSGSQAVYLVDLSMY